VLKAHYRAHSKRCDLIQPVREVEKCDCTGDAGRLFERDPSVRYCPVLIITVCGQVQVKARRPAPRQPDVFGLERKEKPTLRR
jgi:hypothetical protein